MSIAEPMDPDAVLDRGGWHGRSRLRGVAAQPADEADAFATGTWCRIETPTRRRPRSLSAKRWASQMKPEYISLIAGFIGTVLGTFVSLISIWLHQRAQERRERAKLSLDAAVKDFESAEKHAEFMANQGKVIVTHDLGDYIVLHTKLMAHITSKSHITKEQWVAAHKQAIKISEAFAEFHKQCRAAQPDAPAELVRWAS